MLVYRIPYSTNVERVALALAHKSIAVEWVDVDPDDRSPVVALTGQDLVPVMATDHGEVVADSMRIVSWLEKRRPDPPLWPASLARRAEVDVFIEWFNRVWKLPPNAMAAELTGPEPDQQRLHDLSDELRGWLHLFEEMLDGRDWLMGEAFGAADICAFPFLKYGVLELRSDDTDPFHRVLSEHLPISGAFPEIEAWVHRVDALPRA
jgi:glutathione S-transferase